MKNSPDTTIRTVTPELAYLVSDNSVKKMTYHFNSTSVLFCNSKLRHVVFWGGVDSGGSFLKSERVYVSIDYVCVGL